MAAVILTLLWGCSDYELRANDDGDRPPGSDTDAGTPDGEGNGDELCNGVDDDDDGDVDEGYPDTDGDGLADCLDEDCEVAPAAAGEVAVLPECTAYDAGTVTDPWDVSLEWSYTASGYSVVSPVTGQLTDDNGDGVIDGRDMPDVAYTGYNDANLYILSGDGSGLICKAAGFRSDGGVIIADVDGDGQNEVVGPTADSRVRAVDGACKTKWVSARTYSMLYPVTTAADLDADGVVEVIADAAVVDGRTGAHVASLAPANSRCWRTPITGDIDLDGQVEIVLGNTVFDGSGTALWSVTGTGSSCFNAIVNLDTDSEAEVVFSYGTRLRAYEHDGTLKWSANTSVSNPGPPCAGDIDGDGEAEVIAPNGHQLIAYEHNGKHKWIATMQDSSGAAGCIVFDMNGDAVYEVLLADERALRVYEGASGTTLYSNTSYGSVTHVETPTVADIDNDGSAEMLVVNSSGTWTGLTVFGHNGSGWPKSGPTWGLHDFSESNQQQDGSIPTTPPTPWLDYNICRGRPHASVPAVANLVVSVDDVCVSSCEQGGVAKIAFQVMNTGGESSGATSVSLYMLAGGVETWYAAQAVGPMAAGEAAAGSTFEVPIGELGEDGFVLRVDDDGAGLGLVSECYEDDNSTRYEESFCS